MSPHPGDFLRPSVLGRRGLTHRRVGGTITFHLTPPDPDFLYTLALPFSYPVPPSVPLQEQVTTGTPVTGPYRLDASMTGEGLVFVRNENFDVWSPAARPDGYAERIEWTFGIDSAAQIDAVAADKADVAFDLTGAPERLEELLVGPRGRFIRHRKPSRGTSPSTPASRPSTTSPRGGR